MLLLPGLPECHSCLSRASSQAERTPAQPVQASTENFLAEFLALSWCFWPGLAVQPLAGKEDVPLVEISCQLHRVFGTKPTSPLEPTPCPESVARDSPMS